MNLDIELGLPTKYQEKQVLLKIYNIDSNNQITGARHVYSDGALFLLVAKTDGKQEWLELTTIKSKGIELLKKAIVDEFFSIENSDESFAGYSLYYEVNLNGRQCKIIVEADLNENLPKVFMKFEELINQYMYRINESVDN